MRYTGKNLIITVNNHAVSYNDEGPDDAPVIVFIHGFPLNKSMWNAQVEELEYSFRVVTYDVRGHGGSGTGDEDFSIELFVKDLLCLMDALKINKTVLCGLSMGGYIALSAIEKYPKRFNALILCNTSCKADTLEAKSNRIKAIESVKENGAEKFAEENLNNLFAPESFATMKIEIAVVREMIVKTSVQTLCNTLLALSIRSETFSKLQDIKVPVLILVGKKDKITPTSFSHLMHEKIKGSSMYIIDHAGHLSNIENPYEFNEQITKFVESGKVKAMNI